MKNNIIAFSIMVAFGMVALSETAMAKPRPKLSKEELVYHPTNSAELGNVLKDLGDVISEAADSGKKVGNTSAKAGKLFESFKEMYEDAKQKRIAAEGDLAKAQDEGKSHNSKIKAQGIALIEQTEKAKLAKRKAEDAQKAREEAEEKAKSSEKDLENDIQSIKDAHKKLHESIKTLNESNQKQEKRNLEKSKKCEELVAENRKNSEGLSGQLAAKIKKLEADYKKAKSIHATLQTDIADMEDLVKQEQEKELSLDDFKDQVMTKVEKFEKDLKALIADADDAEKVEEALEASEENKED